MRHGNEGEVCVHPRQVLASAPFSPLCPLPSCIALLIHLRLTFEEHELIMYPSPRSVARTWLVASGNQSADQADFSILLVAETKHCPFWHTTSPGMLQQVGAADCN